MMNTAFWVVMTYTVHKMPVSRKHNVSIFSAEEYSGKLAQLLPASAGFLLGLLINSEDGGNMFLRSTGLSPTGFVTVQQ
jgi:hypothetical protein